jgi:hypothetical protein
MRKWLVTTSVAGVGWFVVLAGSALAAGEGKRVGDNIGDLLGGWAKSLYVGIAGVVALLFLLNRRFADLAVFLGAAAVVGGFVMAPGEISSLVRDLWRTVTA